VPPCRILLIDDDEATLDVLAGFLADGSRTVVRAHNAKEAYRFYLEQRPDVIVVDLMLPGEGGLDIAAQILEVDAAAPIILYSAHLDDAVIRRATAVGIRDCIAKEHVEDLLDRVREHCAAA
jgi:CheY-like chemotaxis protein